MIYRQPTRPCAHFGPRRTPHSNSTIRSVSFTSFRTTKPCFILRVRVAHSPNRLTGLDFMVFVILLRYSVGMSRVEAKENTLILASTPRSFMLEIESQLTVASRFWFSVTD